MKRSFERVVSLFLALLIGVTVCTMDAYAIKSNNQKDTNDLNTVGELLEELGVEFDQEKGEIYLLDRQITSTSTKTGRSMPSETADVLAVVVRNESSNGEITESTIIAANADNDEANFVDIVVTDPLMSSAKSSPQNYTSGSTLLIILL